MKLMELKRCIDVKWVNFCIFFQNDHVTGWWYSRSCNWFFLSNVWNIVALYKILYMMYNKWPWLTKTSNDGVWKGCGSSTERRKIGKIMFQFFCSCGDRCTVVCIFNPFIPIFSCTICDALQDLVPFVQFEKREKHPWRSVTFSKVPGFNMQLYWKQCSSVSFFSRFLNCRNGTKCIKRLISTWSNLASNIVFNWFCNASFQGHLNVFIIFFEEFKVNWKS